MKIKSEQFHFRDLCKLLQCVALVRSGDSIKKESDNGGKVPALFIYGGLLLCSMNKRDENTFTALLGLKGSTLSANRLLLDILCCTNISILWKMCLFKFLTKFDSDIRFGRRQRVMLYFTCFEELHS